MWPLLNISDLDIVNSANVPPLWPFRKPLSSDRRGSSFAQQSRSRANSSAASAKLPELDLPKQVLPRVDLSRKRAFRRGTPRGAERDKTQPYSRRTTVSVCSATEKVGGGLVELHSVRFESCLRSSAEAFSPSKFATEPS
jgi:hypothetical protein